MNVGLKEIDFATALPLWNKLWPGRVSKVEPLSSMAYLGGYDMTIKQKYADQARFFGAVDNDRNVVIGVFGGHPTSDIHYRARGLYVEPNYQGLGVGTRLVSAVLSAALEAEREVCWCIPRVPNIGFFEGSGFVQVSEPFTDGVEFGPNAYMACVLF